MPKFSLFAVSLRIFAFLVFFAKVSAKAYLNSKFAKVFAREITENFRSAKGVSIQFFSFLQVFALLFLDQHRSLVSWTIPCKLSS